ncbi:hypothetical protein B5K06_29575 [Rhizobium grahamii]|uniref:Uncharacterized protein n=1 Tax=Rhizobium grahamii TaxID=1120045 RepID=A0A370KFY9_9HYPH|nr:hypothetical protein B5K06_29575 [Rhizobium grahamii]
MTNYVMPSGCRVGTVSLSNYDEIGLLPSPIDLWPSEERYFGDYESIVGTNTSKQGFACVRADVSICSWQL